MPGTHAGKRYVHLVGDNPQLALTDRPPTGPYLREANAVLTRWSRTRNGDRWRITLGFAGHQPVRFVLDGTTNCRSPDSPDLQLDSTGNAVSGRLSARQVKSMTLECR